MSDLEAYKNRAEEADARIKELERKLDALSKVQTNSGNATTDPKGPVFIPGSPNVNFPSTHNGGEALPCYESPQGKDSTMGVVVLQEWWGLNQSIQKTTDDFGAQGFHALCPDLYRGKIAKDTEHAGHLLSGLDWPKAVNDIRACVEWLKNNGCKKVGVVGFCMGGALSLASCNIPELDAAVSFYGIPDISNLDLKNIKIPVQAHFGNLDNLKGFSDPESANNLEKKFKDAGVSIEVFRYDGVGHAFTNRDRPEAYNEGICSLAKSRTFEFFKYALKKPVEIGDEFPDVTLYEDNPKGAIKARELFAGKKVILVGIPGAFTPTCSNTHIPGFLQDYDKLKEKGVDLIVMTAVNDPFVLKFFGEHLKVDGKIRMLADHHMELTKALGIVLDAEGALGNKRMKRFSALIQDNKFVAWNLEPSGGGLSCSKSSEIMKALQFGQLQIKVTQT